MEQTKETIDETKPIMVRLTNGELADLRAETGVATDAGAAAAFIRRNLMLIGYRSARGAVGVDGEAQGETHDEADAAPDAAQGEGDGE